MSHVAASSAGTHAEVSERARVPVGRLRVCARQRLTNLCWWFAFCAPLLAGDQAHRHHQACDAEVVQDR